MNALSKIQISVDFLVSHTCCTLIASQCTKIRLGLTLWARLEGRRCFFYHSFLIHLYCMKLTCVFVCPVSAADGQTDDRVLGSQSCVPSDRPAGEEDARQDVRVSRHQTVTRAPLRPESLRRHSGFILLSVKVHSSRSPDRETSPPAGHHGSQSFR